MAALAAMTWTLATAGPASPAEPEGPCALVRTTVHHSEGVDSWNGSYTRPLGRIDAALVFLSFPDSTPTVSTRELADDHIPDTRDYFRTASYGRFDYHLDPVPGYVRMPTASTGYGIERDWNPKDRRRYLRDAVAAADPLVDFSAYDVVFFVADPEAPGVDPDATKIVNLGRPIVADGVRLDHMGTIFEAHPPDHHVLAHESAHIFDLPDLYTRPGDGAPAGEWNTRVGDWDLMGDQKGLSPELFAWHKWKFGWLDGGQVACLAKPGTVRRTLTPVERPGGVKLLVVPIDSSSVYAVEVRSLEGNDAQGCTEGVLVYRVRSDVGSGSGPIRVMDAHPDSAACSGRSVFSPLADAPFGAGSAFRDLAHEVVVRVLGRGPDGSYTVEATRNR
ncbi:peptidase M6 [Wenjunlia tyrosinilytica]|uniref:Peptidase M6 n=2 Tax=Wenjunlia tyrosinilytica TaxID=1544741 RepID=A0A918DYZ4_9ACTN|nr:peptidase M6 [Wenjunlia tyrosinilytica]